MRIVRPLFALLATTGFLAATAATFTITHVNTPTAEAAAIDHAAVIWGGILESPVPIKVRVTFAPLGGTTLGITFPNGRRDFANAPLPQTWYATALANSIAGTELNPGESDMDIFLNSATNWYTGLDGNPGAGQMDLVSVALHEMGHGLGFIGLSKKIGTEGSLGLLTAADFAPLFTSFPWPQLDTLPGVFDVFLSDQQDGPLTMMQNPGTQLGDAMSGDQLYFNGPLVLSVNNGIGARIYAPTTFALGSSCVHFNEASYPPGNANELMTPFSSAGSANHWPGPLCLALMQDIGWTLAPDVGIAEVDGSTALTVWPVPSERELHFTLPGISGAVRYVIMDLQGRVLREGRSDGHLVVDALAAGTYVIVLPQLGQRRTFVKA